MKGGRVKRSAGGKAAGPSLPSFLFSLHCINFQRAGGAESYEDVLFPSSGSMESAPPDPGKFHPAFLPLIYIVGSREKMSHAGEAACPVKP